MSLGEIGENQGSWEETGNAPMIILRYMGSGMYERCDLELGRPYLSPKGKEDTYKDTFYVLFVDGITRNITKDKDLKDYEIPDKG